MSAKPPPFPVRITLALGLVLTTAAWNMARVWSSISLWSVIEEYSVVAGPAYIGATGALWAVSGLLLVFFVWRRHIWALRALFWGTLAYAAWYWLDRLFLQPNLDPGWPFSLLLTALQLAIIVAATLPASNRFYLGREAHERKEQDR